MSPPSPVAARHVAALLFNAFVWGVSWWPLRALESRGLHPLWATAAIFVIGSVAIVMVRPGAATQLWRTRALWWLVLAAGTTNAAFNWGVVVGDVVRVVLLFYLMPLWSLLFARLLLGERLTRGALLRVVLALAGAAIVLGPDATGSQGLRLGLAEGLGLLGGMSFALNNVMLRRLGGEPKSARALAMFSGGAVVSLVLGLLVPGAAPTGLAVSGDWWTILLPLAACYLLSNLALQHGAAHLPASVTSVVMLSEIVFATASAIALGGGHLTPTTLAGGLLILGAAALSVRDAASRGAGTKSSTTKR